MGRQVVREDCGKDTHGGTQTGGTHQFVSVNQAGGEEIDVLAITKVKRTRCDR